MLRIKEARTKAGLSQATLAERAEIGQSDLSKYERNVRVPGLDVAARIAKALDIPIEELYVAPQEPTGKLIHNARMKLGMTQQRLASQLGVDVRTVSNWEKGKSEPDALHRRLLSANLGFWDGVPGGASLVAEPTPTYAPSTDVEQSRHASC